MAHNPEPTICEQARWRTVGDDGGLHYGCVIGSHTTEDQVCAEKVQQWLNMPELPARCWFELPSSSFGFVLNELDRTGTPSRSLTMWGVGNSLILQFTQDQTLTVYRVLTVLHQMHVEYVVHEFNPTTMLMCGRSSLVA